LVFGTLTTLLWFAFVLGVLVFVHELGHFLAAKRVGVRVLKFQLGFNPTILSFTRGDTEYSIGALPLGGYVKMAGDNPEEHRTGAPDEFLSKSKWERFQVLVMGPVMNLGLAVILMAVVLYQGAERLAYEDKPVLVGVVEQGSPAAQAGIKPGDRIVSVNDKEVESWEAFYMALSPKTNQEVTVGFERDGTVQTARVTPVPPPDSKSRFEFGEIGVLPDTHPHVATIIPGEAAERAGLKPNDIVLSVNNEPITFSADLKKAIASRPEQEISLSILRDGEPMAVLATPRRQGDEGLLGITIADDVVSVKPGLVGAARMSVERNLQISGMIFHTLGGLFTRETSPKQLMGPVAIAQLSGESAKLGWLTLLALMAQLSLNLGLLNLMPIPVLDGGHIFIMSLEGLARRDFSIRLKEKMLLAGFVTLLLLMVTVIYNDLTRITWIERLMPWR
jgi:regulator of sigma E protease